jgi:hypothetical protein
MTINNFSITKSDYILIANDSGIDFSLGSGVDMNYPDQPQGRDSAFEIDTIDANENKTEVNQNDLRFSQIDYIESSYLEDYYRALSFNIKANYGLSSASMNYARIQTEQKNYFMVIVLITDSMVNTISIKPETKFVKEPTSETSNDDDTLKTYQFLQDFGSHYISKISFGYQIAFEAKVNKTQFSDETSFSGALSASYGAFSASGEINMTEINKLKTKGVSITGRINCGGITPDRPLIINSIEDLTNFMQSLSTGEKIIKRGPLKIFLRSYFHKLQDYPKTRSLLAPTLTDATKGVFGVPQGSIISYYPPIDIGIEELLKDNEYYWLPDGWAICNGSKNTPNLIDKFIMGSSEKNIRETGGSVEHKHTEQSFLNWDLPIDVSGNHSGVFIHPANHLPPFYKLIYLMKL